MQAEGGGAHVHALWQAVYGKGSRCWASAMQTALKICRPGRFPKMSAALPDTPNCRIEEA